MIVDKLKDLRLFIHTYGRPKRQLTLARLSPRVRKRTWLVVQKRERSLYDYERLLVLPDRIRSLSPTRQFLLEYSHRKGHDKIVMMDDDLVFLVRKNPDDLRDWHLRNTKNRDVDDMFALLSGWLDDYTHCGVSARHNNNKPTDMRKPWASDECGRMMRLLAYNVPRVMETGARFDRMELKQDFDMTLQLLGAGHKNIVSYIYSQGQVGFSDSPGGCSSYRTSELMRECAFKLAELHPGVVKVVKKKTKKDKSWKRFGGVRIDVSVAWKQAYENSSIAQMTKPKDGLI